MGSPLEAWVRPVTALVVGDVMLDRYTFGNVSRISPEAPVPVVVRERVSVTPGGAGNAAANIAALSSTVAVVAAVGDDAEGRLLRSTLELAGIDVSGLVTTATSTCVKHRVLASGQQIVRVDTEPESPLEPKVITDILEQFRRRLHDVDVVLLSDYLKGVCTFELCREVIDASVEAGKPVIVDPKRSDFGAYSHATIVTPNFAEARLASRDPCANVNEMGQSLVDTTASAVLITRGADGMTLYRPRDSFVHLPSRAQHVYDVTGAGDTVVAAVAVGVAQGTALPEACRIANEAAAIAVSRPGTTMVTMAELLVATTPG